MVSITEMSPGHWNDEGLLFLKAGVLKGNKNLEISWTGMKAKVLKRDGKQCRYCGGKYDKYLYRSYVNGNKNYQTLDNLVVACKLCHKITQLGPYHLRELVACVSDLPQRTIVRTFVDHYLKTQKFLTIREIDPEACKP